MTPSTFPYLVATDDAVHFRAETVYATDYAHAVELSVDVVKRWRDEARAQGKVFAPRNGVRVFVKSGSMQAVRPP